MRYFPSKYIPDNDEWVENGVPCPFCNETMTSFCLMVEGYTDLIDDVIFECGCDKTYNDDIYNYQLKTKMD